MEKRDFQGPTQFPRITEYLDLPDPLGLEATLAVRVLGETVSWARRVSEETVATLASASKESRDHLGIRENLDDLEVALLVQ